MPNSILLAIDLSDSESSQQALDGALELLSESGTLHVVSVLPDFGLAQVSGYFKTDYEEKALLRLGHALEDWAQTQVPKNINVRPHVLHGRIYHEVLKAADKLSVEVIVLGAHRPELKDYFLGPNAARIVRHAKQSVYVIRN
jgi:nucleotide-binding universal stress UspA family protein